MHRKIYSLVSVFVFCEILYVLGDLAADVGSCTKDKDECGENGPSLLDEIRLKDEPLVFTVASQKTDGFLRYERSAREYGIQPIVLGLDEPWKGGPMDHPGGGYKVNLLLRALEPWKDDKEKIAIFTDSYDVMYLAPIRNILVKFSAFDARVLFGAEPYCWPDKKLSEKYPTPENGGKKYLNSGMFIGYTSDLYSILSRTPIKDEDDDQLFYTKAYLDEELRKKHKMILDHKSEIFQNMNGATGEIKLDFEMANVGVSLLNTEYRTRPSVVHGNGPSKTLLNSYGNYLANAWNAKECQSCKANTIDIKDDQIPTIGLSIFIERPTPFLEEFLENIWALNYPKDHMHLFIHNTVLQHADIVTKFFEEHGPAFQSQKSILFSDNTAEADARDLAVKHCINKGCDYFFALDSDAHLDNPETLQLLIKQNRRVLAPLLSRPGEAWSNFWGALSDQGFYARSFDYMDIVHNEMKGVWNVPFISSSYLISSDVLDKVSFKLGTTDPDMAFCYNLRQEGVFMFVTNLHEFGHLINTDDFDPKIVSPDLYQLKNNKMDWEKKYIHPKWVENFNPNNTAEQPCPDVYWFPIVTDRFCSDLINVMEAFGRWSEGKNDDTRLEGGYEAVPTRDIHMNQVGLEPLWLKFLKDYIRPLQELVFTGYYHDPPRSLMNFVVRYRPDEQPSLRPHHDSSTYTINIALNRPGIDYEGGGCHFIRYKCSVTQTKIGWLLIHPGRLTHYHEGLRVTNGTRYIMISFVDP